MEKFTVFIIKKDDKEPIQCIESVRNQLFVSDPYIKQMVYEYEPILKIVAKDIMEIDSEYFFICDSGSILSTDLISDMIDTIKYNDATAVAAYTLFYDGMSYKVGGYCHDTVLGKLFKTDTRRRIFPRGSTSRQYAH